ncbi:MAG: hypothetical protein ACI399_02435 [Candidatus Cryptobacteroides sp.]
MTTRKFIAAAAAFVLAVMSLPAQTPTTTWPYLYGEFTDGVVCLSKKGEIEGKFNICLDGCVLHFIDKDMVKSHSSAEVLSVRIGKDIFQNVYGRLLKVLDMSDKCLIVQENEIDFASLNSTEAAYGSSSTTLGNMSLSSAEGIGGTNTSASLNHMELKHNRDQGKELPLIVKNYIFVKGRKIFCTKKDVLEIAPDKDSMKQFLKENPVKWKEPHSVLAVGDFLYSQF